MGRCVRVKICGITRLEDALAACRAGADALGFNFHEGSPRHVALDRAGAISRRLPPFVGRVGVFVNPSQALVERALATLRLDWLQFHGGEDYDFVSRFPGDMVIKALRLRERRDLKGLKAFAGCAALLVDAAAPGAYGGTGRLADWGLAGEARRKSGRPLILAGGLKADNVAAAVKVVRPWAVDAASGVESAPGIKDAEKMAAFVAAAKSVPT